MQDVFSHEVGAPRVERDSPNNLFRSELQISILDGGVDDEASKRGELSDAHTAHVGIDDAKEKVALLIRLVDARRDHDRQSLEALIFHRQDE